MSNRISANDGAQSVASLPPRNGSAFRRHGPLWIAGRVGILVVFGIMPLMRACDRIKTSPLRGAHQKCMAAYAECNKYPVASEAWNTNKAAGDYWLGEAQKLRVKYYGTNQ